MWRPNGTFEVKTDSGWTSAWGNAFKLPDVVPVVRTLDYQTDVEKKKAYGIELAKVNAKDRDGYFAAACKVFEEDTSAALWVSANWLSDPIVVASRDAYAVAAKTAQPLLDKDGLAAKLLECAEEKIERNGQKFYVNEAKDRLGFLKLYAEVMGFAGKLNIDASTSFTNQEMKVVLVKPDEKPETKTITPVEHIDLDDTNITPLRIKIV